MLKENYDRYFVHVSEPSINSPNILAKTIDRTSYMILQVPRDI